PTRTATRSTDYTLVREEPVISAVVDTSHPAGRAVLAGVAILGVIVGILLQPSPRPEDHKPRARQAIQNLATSIELIQDVRTVGGQLNEAEIEIRTKTGLISMDQDLRRAKAHLMHSMAEWDQVAPGAVEEFRKTQQRGRQILMQLAQEEGAGNE
ncbi:hypothetical protein, partial [Gulosibacter sp. 10]|uniref:hypothetical protein n=1 Tax=Gulosibacter sp. 10 TaxID=1255570 RepID=UPI001C3C9007